MPDPATEMMMPELLPYEPGSPEQYWQDYEYTTGRSKPTGSVHCQRHHHEFVSFRRAGAYRPGYSIKLPPSDRRTCFICEGTHHA